MKRYTILSLLLVGQLSTSAQQPTNLDHSFGNQGVLVMPFEKEVQWGDDKINSIALQKDGKILSSWNTAVSFGVIRHHQDGTVDSSFATNGRIIGNEFKELRTASDIMVLPDDKFIVAGSTFGAAKFLANGLIDTTFNGTGIVTHQSLGPGGCYGGTLQPDGKIVLCGNDDDTAKIVRLNTNGSIDSSFHNNGFFTERFKGASTKIYSVEVKPNGSILVSGVLENTDLYFFVFQLKPNGFLDSTFGTDGYVITDINGSAFAHDMALLNDGKILLAGRSVFGGALMARYMPDGSLDNTFGSNGTVFTTMPNGDIGPEEVEVDKDGNIYLGGHINKGGIDDDLYLLRYRSNGTLDSDFSKQGIVTKLGSSEDRVRDMIIQPDGKILLAGYHDGSKAVLGTIVRYMPFPVSVTKTHLNTSIQLYPNPSSSNLSVNNLPSDVGSYYITDISGKHILSKNKSFAIDQINIDVTNLPSGIYTFHFLSNNDHLTKQFTKL